MFKKISAKPENAFRTSDSSRNVTASGIQGSATVAETSGTTDTKQQWAPASRNAAELINNWSDVFNTLDPG